VRDVPLFMHAAGCFEVLFETRRENDKPRGLHR